MPDDIPTPILLLWLVGVCLVAAAVYWPDFQQWRRQRRRGGRGR